jgi:hypothetical protein
MTTTVKPTTAPIDTQSESPLAHLSEEQLEQLAREFDAIRDRVTADLGERDRRYIESMIEMQRGPPGPPGPPPSRRRRSSRTWRSATTSCTASGTG